MPDPPSDRFYLPDWVSDLRPLKDNASWLANLASDPVSTLRTTVRTILSVIVVGGVLDMARELVTALLAVLEAIVSIPASMASLLGSAGSAISSELLGVGYWYVGWIEGIAASMGPFGIFVQVAAYVGTAVLVVRAIPPLLNATSDLLGAIPVVGSVADAVLTFAVGFGGRLSALLRGD